MEFLHYLSTSALTQWLLTSYYGFPVLIGLHSVGMGIVVGLSLMVCLRLYNVFDGLSAQSVSTLLNVAVCGFALNLVTGLLIFMTRAPEYITSAIYLFKMALVLLSATLLWWLRRRLRSSSSAGVALVADTTTKRVSLAASLTWFCAVLAGRMIAYLSDLY